MSNTHKNKTTTVTGGSFGDNKVHFSETERTDGKGTDRVVQSTTPDGKEHITVHPDGKINFHGNNGKITSYPNS